MGKGDTDRTVDTVAYRSHQQWKLDREGPSRRRCGTCLDFVPGGCPDCTPTMHPGLPPGVDPEQVPS